MSQPYFERGHVFKCAIPKAIHTTMTPEPSFILHGEHYFILLHDSAAPDTDPRLALAVPITSASAEVKKALREGRSILASYVPIGQAEYPFLDHDSYVSTAQILPVNREWLHTGPVDKIREDKLAEIDIQVIQNIGLMNTVVEMASQLYELQQARRQAAPSDEQSG